MNTVDLLAKKRDGQALTKDELAFLIRGAVDRSIPDYQLAAFLMAGRIQGFTMQETLDMTLLMAESGQKLDLSAVPGCKVDKHSTGGVGDKVSLVVLPIAAAAGLVGAKMSGRGLGHTGGTLDKLESVPGLRTELSIPAFLEQLRTVGLAIISQNQELAPADKVFYGLRDVTATVDSLPLIAASIMSKKLAVGADVLVLDVKYGSGAMLPQVEQARKLASLMVQIAQGAGIRATAVLSSMEQPLGRAIGNSLEVLEAAETLQGGGPADLRQVCLTLAGEQMFLAGLFPSREAAWEQATALLDSGKAYERFRAMLKAQGGTDDLSLLPKARLVREYPAATDGYLAGCDTAGLGRAGILLGAGRRKKGDPLHYGAGFLLRHKIGDPVRAGEPLLLIYGDDESAMTEAEQALSGCFHFSKTPVVEPKLLLERFSTMDGWDNF